MSFYGGRDRYFYPVVVTQENNTLIVDEAGTDYTITIPPGVYWNHLDRTQSILDEYPSLVLEVIDQINASGTSATYAASVLDLPTGDLRYSSIYIEQSSGGLVGSWGFRFDDSSNTFDSGYLGFERDLNVGKSTGNRLEGETSVLGQWISPGPAAFKDRDVSKNVFRSDKGSNAVVNSWTPAKDTRNIKYWKVPGSFVYDSRAKTNTDGTADGLPDNDTNNAFEDVIRAMGDSRILAKYNVSDESDAMEFNTESPSVSESWQSQAGDVKLSEARGDREKWEGEHYDLAWPAVIYENEPVLNGYGH